MNKVNHYKWLDKHFPEFCHKLGIDFNNCCPGIVSAHGDKAYGYRDQFEKAGIPFPHGVAIYFLTYLRPFDKESRETENGWVAPIDWIIKNKDRFLPLLPSIDENDPDVCDRTLEESKEDAEYHRQADIEDTNVVAEKEFLEAISRDAAKFELNESIPVSFQYEDDPIEMAHGKSGSISPSFFKETGWKYKFVRLANGIVLFGDACSMNASHKSIIDEYNAGDNPTVGITDTGHPAPAVFAGSIRVKGKRWCMSDGGSTTLGLQCGVNDEKYIDRVLSQYGFKYDGDLWYE